MKKRMCESSERMRGKHARGCGRERSMTTTRNVRKRMFFVILVLMSVVHGSECFSEISIFYFIKKTSSYHSFHL